MTAVDTVGNAVRARPEAVAVGVAPCRWTIGLGVAVAGVEVCGRGVAVGVLEGSAAPRRSGVGVVGHVDVGVAVATGVFVAFLSPSRSRSCSSESSEDGAVGRGVGVPDTWVVAGEGVRVGSESLSLLPS